MQKVRKRGLSDTVWRCSLDVGDEFVYLYIVWTHWYRVNDLL